MDKKECCPVFDPAKWDEKHHSWIEKRFIKETIPTLFNIPFPPMIGNKISKMCKLASASQAEYEDKQDWLVLFRDPTPFKSEMYMSVTKEVQSAKNVQISGSFVSKVFDGPYNAVPKFIKAMDEYLATEGRGAKDYYVHYAYCPKCSKENGHNYMVLFAKI